MRPINSFEVCLILCSLLESCHLSRVPSLKFTEVRGHTGDRSHSVVNLKANQNAAKAMGKSRKCTRLFPSSPSEPMEVGKSSAIAEEIQEDAESEYWLPNTLGKKRENGMCERIWNRSRKAWRSLFQKIKNGLARVVEFFWGDIWESDTDPPGIRYSVPKEEDERAKIVQNFIGAVPRGKDTPAWFKELETSFRNLPAITKWREDRQDYAQTRNLLNNLINALVDKPLTVPQRTVIMSAINHITSYNREAKQALYEYANEEPLIFKTLALTIQDIRPNRVPDITLKHSFEAGWLSTSTAVEEKFYRIALVDSNLSCLSDRAKKIGQRLENCRDIHAWTKQSKSKAGKTEDKTEDGEIKTIMLDAINLLKDSTDRDDRIYIYHIIRYIVIVDQIAHQIFVKELEEEDFREAVVRILFILHGKNLIDRVPENSLEGRLLSDLDTGPLLERTALKLIVSSNPPPENIRALSNRILSQGNNTDRWTSTHDNPESAYAVLKELIGLIGSKQRKNVRYTAWENEILMRLLAYLNRWNPFIKREIQKYIHEDETFLEFLATRIAREYPDGAYVDAPKMTFEHKLLANTYLAERFARHELRYLNTQKTARELRRTLKKVDGLPNRWYEDPLAPEPRRIIQSLLLFLKTCHSSKTGGQANIAVKVLQHLSQFQPALKELILVNISQENSLQLRLHLRNYREMFKSNKRKVNTRLFLDWLNDLPDLNDTSQDQEEMVSRYSLRRALWNAMVISKRKFLNWV